MLRLYVPIETDNIFSLHRTLKHLVCEVWCKADDNSCESKMNEELKALAKYSYKTGLTFKAEIERIYELFKKIEEPERDKIIKSFEQAELIENLCNRAIEPILLSDLNDCVEEDIKPLFRWCYEDLLDKEKVAGDKLAFYKKLIKGNKFLICPCCGLIDFESDDEDNEVREAYDHYLPKSEFPFASVCFKNLVPLCYKCNSDRKKAKNPIENTRKAFYPFAKDAQNIVISLKIDETKAIDALERNDLKIAFTGDKEKLDTWDWLFGIKTRYNDTIRGFSKTFLRRIKRRHYDYKEGKPDWTYQKSLDKLINDYEPDKYEDKKFLKIALMHELKNCTDLIDVYG